MWSFKVFLVCVVIFLCNFDRSTLARRRTPGGSRTFESRPGMGHARYMGEEVVFEESKDDEASDKEESRPQPSRLSSSERSGSDAVQTTTLESTGKTVDGGKLPTDLKVENEEIVKDEKAAFDILKGLKTTNYTLILNDELDNIAVVPSDFIKDDIYWIDATFKAVDAGMNISNVKECHNWQKYWSISDNSTEYNFKFISINNDTDLSEYDYPESEEEAADDSDEVKVKKVKTIRLVDYEVMDSKSRLKKLGITTDLINKYEAVGVLFKEVCGNHDRQLVYKTPEDARKIGIDENSTICNPFKIELQPNIETLTTLAIDLNQLIEKVTKRNASAEDGKRKQSGYKEDTMDLVVFSKNGAKKTATDGDVSAKSDSTEGGGEVRLVEDDQKELRRLRLRRKADEHKKEAKKKKELINHVKSGKSDEKQSTVVTTEAPSAEENEDEADWLELLEFSKQVLDNLASNETFAIEKAWIQIDATDETNPVMHILYPEAAEGLGLLIPHHSFKRYEKVGLFLPGVCADYVPTAIDAFNASDFEGIEIEGPIGVNISALESAGVNLTELAEKLRNDTEVDEILTRTNETTRALGGSYILPVLNKNQYDPFSAPIVFQGSAVVVRFGIYIESMSNFQTSTMDYDMDIYLILAWRDARLVNPYDKPILVKEEEILEKIWRPDPFFDAKEAEFHEVTFLNFLMRIYNDGLVLYETRIKLKPACNLILCKYPHDKQTCELQIKSFAYPIETVRFEWFTRKVDAIDKNPDVKLPELYIDRYEPTLCNRSRKSGDFSCLRAVFRLKRDVGFHIAQTYIPTSLALMFSWVGVWLPEEFMEGRIGVAITVLLTLSTESAGAREHLPSVSYLKAIDLWFGYITGFVFFTLLQTLFVIGFDKRANQLRKWANRKRLDLTQEARDSMISKANRYHKTGRYLDNFCRVFYPLSFILFLIMYYFVFTEGRQDDCISTR